MMTLLSWLPSEYMVMGIALIGLGLIVGLIKLRRAAALLGFIVLLIVTGPFIDVLLGAFFDRAPWWLLLLLAVFMVFSLLGILLRFLIGRRATDHMVGSLAADAIRFAFRMIFGLVAMPFRLVFGRR